MEALQFSNSTFHKGRNLTVRRGIKWDTVSKKNVSIVDISDSTQTSTFSVDISTKVIRFSDLTDSDIKNEHIVSCRTIDGLLSEMQRIYPNFDVREVVTLVEFDVN